MTAAWLALAIALAGCGRLGFQQTDGPSRDGGPDVAAGDLVTVVVTSDQYLAEMAGTPIAGATVLVERSSGTDRLMTDATGTVRFPAPVPGTFDVLSIVKLDVPGATLADLVPTIDRRWPSWPHDPLLLPPVGGAMSRMLYSRSLGAAVAAPAP